MQHGVADNPPEPPERDDALVDAARRQVYGDGVNAGLSLGSECLQADVSSASALLASDSLPGYQILREIHRGGQGVVYQAIQESTERKVAVKVVREGPFAGPADRARFEREVRVLGRLNHPNIVAIHDSGEAAGRFYYVMDYIPGQPLDAYMLSARRSINDTLELFVKICDAVNAAHLRGVIHRDLKPGNIRIDSQGEPHVLDFGLAKLTPVDQEDGSQPQAMTVTGQFLGSLPWASPEQAEAEPSKIDTRTDVYSLGVILYQMLTGRFPYEVVGNMRDVLDRIMRAEPTRPSTIRRQINDEVETIVLKCLSKEPDRRYQTAGEVAQDIRRYLAGEAIFARPPSFAYQLRVFARRNKGLVGASASIFAVLLVAVVVSVSLYLRSERALAQAEAAFIAEAEQRDQAEIEARKADQVATFIGEMLSAVDPAVAGTLDKALMKMVLDNASERIDIELAGQPEIEAQIRHIIGNVYHSVDEHDSAQVHLEKALAIREATLGEEHADTLLSMIALAFVYVGQGHYEGAEGLCARALEIAQDVLGEDNEQTLGAMNDLALIYYNQGRFDEAEQLYRRALDVASQALGGEHQETQSAMMGLAGVFTKQGRYDQTEALYLNVLEVRRRTLGEEDLKTVHAMQNLGSFYIECGRYDDAEPLLRATLEARRRVLGEDHRGTLISLNDLAALHWYQGRYADAEALFREALKRTRQAVGDDHRDTSLAANNLAAVCKRQKRWDEAADLYGEALRICRRVLGDEHPETLDSMNNLACLYLDQGRLDEAESLYQETLRLRRRVLGEEHPDTAESLGNLGMLCDRQGRFDQAESLCSRALEIQRQVLGEEHPDTLRTMSNLAAVLQKQGRCDEARELQTMALEGRRRVLGDRHPMIGGSLYRLAETLACQGDYEEALRLSDEAVKIMDAALPDDHWVRAHVHAVHGSCLARLQRYAEAEVELLGAHKALETALRPGDQRTASTLRKLVRLYEAWGKPEQAARWRAKLTQGPASTRPATIQAESSTDDN